MGKNFTNSNKLIETKKNFQLKMLIFPTKTSVLFFLRWNYSNLYFYGFPVDRCVTSRHTIYGYGFFMHVGRLSSSRAASMSLFLVWHLSFWWRGIIVSFYRYYIWRGKPHLAHAFSSTQATRTSNVSTADTATVSNDYRLHPIRNGKVEEKPLSMY